ncbi:MAG: NAD(P)H-hydrate dehydratase [Paucibacter sp.]|nr:NAD(P)H-hydrate dehydratase [Roseateles sp.]
MRKLLPLNERLPLFDVANSRLIETEALRLRPQLMEDAGLAVAKLALALYAGEGSVWIACGPGNNGGDGRVAARHLLQHGLTVHLDEPAADTSLVIDALLGLGLKRAVEGDMAERIARINALGACVLSVDLPSGLDADRGQVLGSAVRADHTLVLLTLKPGLFTGLGRDHCGELWFEDLGVLPEAAPSALLLGRDALTAFSAGARHSAHKGSQGDVLVVGGAPGMRGAALLAARAALASGAGRVWCGLLDAGADLPDAGRPELMHAKPDADLQRYDAIACGSGGGLEIAALLPSVLRQARRLVLDADALNAIAREPALGRALQRRPAPTLLTPHPLEAARLLQTDTGAVQADRPGAAGELARRYGATVILKGSGTVIAATGRAPAINSSGSGALATAGTGDVLAGWCAGLWARHASAEAFEVACAAVHLHGLAGQESRGLAAELIRAMRAWPEVSI